MSLLVYEIGRIVSSTNLNEYIQIANNVGFGITGRFGTVIDYEANTSVIIFDITKKTISIRNVYGGKYCYLGIIYNDPFNKFPADENTIKVDLVTKALSDV